MALRIGRFLTISVLLSVTPATVAGAADVSLACPDTWTDGARTTLTCTVNATAPTRDVCHSLTDTLDFYFKERTSSAPVSLCQVQDFKAQCNGGSAGPCQCRRADDGNYVFTYPVLASRLTHGGGSWQCLFTCRDVDLRDPLEYAVSTGCSPVLFAAPPAGQLPPTSTSTTTTTTTTTAHAAASGDCHAIDCRPQCNNAGCACVIVFPIIFVVVAVGVFIYCWRRRGQKQREITKDGKQDTEGAAQEQSTPAPPGKSGKDDLGLPVPPGVQHVHYHIQNFQKIEINKAVLMTKDGLPPDGPVSFSQIPGVDRLLRQMSIQQASPSTVDEEPGS